MYDLIANGMPTTGPGSMALLTTPQYTAPNNTATVRVGAWIRNTYGTSGSQSFFVDCFDLETVRAYRARRLSRPNPLKRRLRPEQP